MRSKYPSQEQKSDISALVPACLSLVAALLIALCFFLLDHAPKPAATSQQLLQFYQDGGNRLTVLLGLYLAPFAGMALLWFVVTLRAWMLQKGNAISKMFSMVQLGGLLIFVCLFFGAASARGVMAASVEFLGISPAALDNLRAFPLFAYVLLYVYAMRGAAMLILVTSRVGQITGQFPGWLSIVGFVLAIILFLSITFHPLLVLLLPIWLLLISGTLFVQNHFQHTRTEAS